MRSIIFKISFAIAFLLGNMAGVLAQSEAQDSVFTLSTIQVVADKIRQEAVGSVQEVWAAERLEKLSSNDVAALLQSETATYIKSYGLGSLATSSVRGGSAGHLLLLWNGLPIHSPMLGLLDLALLPMQAAESIHFTKGGNAAMWGSGAIGGVLGMDNEADFSRRWRIKSSSQLGSFGHFRQALELGVGNKKLQSVSKLSHQQAENDFSYWLAAGLPRRRQANARLSQQAWQQDLYWKASHRHHFALHAWWQQSDRQIPPTNVQNRSEAYQLDQSARFMATYKSPVEKGLWSAKLAFFDEQLDFFDDRIRLASESRFRTYLAEFSRQWFWGSSELLLGNFHTQTRAWSAGYREDVPSEYRTALFAAWKHTGKLFQAQLSFRQEMVDAALIPFAPALGFQWQLAPALAIKGKVSRNYRLPTLNDRFWLPGGNPDLLAEVGWSQELSLVHEKKRSLFSLEASLSIFNRNITNWILWSIQDGQPHWSANNIAQVWSRGVEPRLSATYTLGEFKLQSRLGYDYIRSTNQLALTNPRIRAGEQLIYTPVHQAFGSFAADWKNFHLHYQHHFTGASSGINDLLPAFFLGNARFQYGTTTKKHRLLLHLSIHNIWNTNYLVVERRPMPGIHFQTGINFHFNQNK